MRSNHWMIIGLVAVNAVLGGALLLRSGAGLEKKVYGQIGARPNLVVVPGSYKAYGVIYVLDTTKGDLAMFQLDGKNTQTLLGGINISKDLERAK